MNNNDTVIYENMVKQGVNANKRGANNIVFWAGMLYKIMLHYVGDV